KDDFGRIAAQTAKQVIVQKIREAEKESALAEFGQKSGDIVVGHVQRFERG
ncbi:transcription termination/antitermination protein NusA, partial [Candidatus Kaiserbacteria bacterium CG_4_8_14_3_um_filter_38_9]